MSELYNLETDPMQQRNLIADKHDVAEEMRQAFINFLKQLDAPAGTVEPFVSESSPREHLSPDQNLHCIRDERGKIIAFGTKEQAKASIAPQMRHQEIDAISYGALVERDPKALIKMHGQFYWAEDLLGR